MVLITMTGKEAFDAIMDQAHVMVEMTTMRSRSVQYIPLSTPHARSLLLFLCIL